MSIYSIMAFNAAADKMKQNIADSQSIDAKKVQTQTAQEQLDLNKKLDQAKIKQARNEGMMNDFIGNQLEDKLNQHYKAKNDQLDAISGLQDIAKHKAQQGAQQAGQFATQLHASDPDVQGHVNTLSAIMQANQPPVSAPSAASTVMPTLTSAGQGASPDQPSALAGGQGPDGVRIPSIFPLTGGPMASPLQKQQQIPVESPQPEQAQPAQVETTQEQPQTAPAPAQSQGGFDLSPIEQAFGMPKGSMWLNPSTMKPEISPVWKANMQAHQRAQAAYDVNQPFREVQRQDKLEQRATQLVTKVIQNRSGGIGLQDNKVNAAIHARELINQSYNPKTGEFDVTQVPYGELAESLGSLLSGGTGSSEGRINSLKQRTGEGDLNAAISYITGKPSNATSQDALKQLVHMIDRQGQVSEDLRNDYLKELKKLPVFNELSPERAQALLDTNIGSSFKEHLKNSPDKQGKMSQGKLIEGRTYKDAKDRRAMYLNGTWVDPDTQKPLS